MLLLRIGVEMKNFKEFKAELLKQEEKGTLAIADAVNNGGKFLSSQISRKFPKGDAENGHIRTSTKLKKAKPNKKKSVQRSLVTVGNKQFVYGVSQEFGHYSKNKKKRIKGTEHLGKIVYDESIAKKTADIMVETLLKRIGW